MSTLNLIRVENGCSLIDSYGTRSAYFLNGEITVRPHCSYIKDVEQVGYEIMAYFIDVNLDFLVSIIKGHTPSKEDKSIVLATNALDPPYAAFYFNSHEVSHFIEFDKAPSIKKLSVALDTTKAFFNGMNLAVRKNLLHVQTNLIKPEEGNCPVCNDRGYWKAMALFCSNGHGRFMG